MQLHKAFLGALVLLGTAQPTRSSAIEAIDPTISSKLVPELIEALAEPTPGISVIVLMRDQVDLERLNAELTAAAVDRRGRPARVIPMLKAKAKETQAPLWDAIAELQAAGAVAAAKPLWLVNAVLVRGTPEAIVAIAGRAEVARVFIDGPIGTDHAFPESAGRATSSSTMSPGAAEPGLRVTGAPTLWGMGFTGAGILVMNLDSGVDGQHPSMATRWLGLDAGVLSTDAWFDNPFTMACPTPCDYDTHGTLTLSVVTGLETATSDTVGVAFGSKWIAGVATGTTTGTVLTEMQWAANPPGGTRPPADVMSLSIQDPSVNQAGDCGPNGTYWAAVDGFEALGGAVVWAAGNEGPGAMTINRPKNRISTPVNMFTVGNISPHVPTFPIHTTSSRGPSNCDGATPKPEVVAPGTTIRVATPGGSYGTFSGTSLAAPHAAGVIALLMQAFPGVTGTEIKLALLATARDLGVPGDDNTYGMGLIDAARAFNLLQNTLAIDDHGSQAPTAAVTLSEAHPNPFQPATSLRIGLPAAARVTVRVYNLRGQAVASLLESEARSAGSHEIVWDGRTAAGERAPSGVYFFRLTTDTGDAGQVGTWFRKVVLVD
jgi:subtilisin family serine protease